MLDEVMRGTLMMGLVSLKEKTSDSLLSFLTHAQRGNHVSTQKNCSHTQAERRGL